MTMFSLVTIHLLYQSFQQKSVDRHMYLQPHNGMHVILFYLHLHLFVVQILRVHCNNSVDSCRGQTPIHKFRDPCIPETELWHSAIHLSDNGLNLASDVGGSLSASFPLLNKYTLIWSIFVISVNGSYILQTNFSTLVSVSSVSSPQPKLDVLLKRFPCCRLAMPNKLAYCIVASSSMESR